MKHTDEYIQTSVKKEAQAKAYAIAEEFWDLLEALNRKGSVRQKLKGARAERREEYLEIERNVDKIFASFNKFLNLYLDKTKRIKFFQITEEFGFTEEDLSHLLHAQLVFMFLMSIEAFKNYLIFVLKGVSPRKTLGQLFRSNRGKPGALVRLTQDSGEAARIAERLDIELRNALTHLLFREVGRHIHYYDYDKREGNWILVEHLISSTELLTKMQDHSLLRALSATVIADWYGI